MCSMIFADQAASLKKFYYKLFLGHPVYFIFVTLTLFAEQEWSVKEVVFQ